jgi:hypothetical protein
MAAGTPSDKVLTEDNAKRLKRANWSVVPAAAAAAAADAGAGAADPAVCAKVTGEATRPMANARVANFFMGFSKVEGLNAKNNNGLILSRFMGHGNSKTLVNPKFVGI